MIRGVPARCPVSDWAERNPARVALRTPEGSIPFAAWDADIAGVAAALGAAGIQAGHRVALVLPPGRDLLDLLLALFRLGAVACPVDPSFPLAYRQGLIARLACDRVIDDPAPWHPAPASSPVAAPGAWRPDAPAVIIFTSGSTGDPRAAVLSLRNLWSAAEASNQNIPLAADDAWLLSLPMHHVAGLGVLFRCLAAGAAIALPGNLALPDAAAALGVTHVSMVARQLALWLDAEERPRLKAILLGGSAIPAPLIDRAVAQGLPVHTSYGMTEMATQAATTPPGAARAVLDSAGRPLIPDSIRVDADGRIQVNGPARFLGYWDHGAIHPPFNPEGWFTTGDCGYFDDAGLLYVTGRADNMFVAGGENIQPEEIERALLRLPRVTQAVVVAVSHAAFGATPVAFVEQADALRPEEIRAALMDVLPKFKVPRYVLPWPRQLAGDGMKVKRGVFAAEAARRVADLG